MTGTARTLAGVTTTPTISQRAVNRATLARQLLLDRSSLPVPAAVEHLAGLQAQTPHTWYVGLWSRLVDLDPVAVGAMLVDRRLVRIALMRSTIHLVTAADAIGLRPLVEPVIVRSTSGNFGRHLVGLDLDALVAAGREILVAEPLIWSELGRRLAERFPGRDEASLAQGVRAHLALVQVPPRGVWGKSGLPVHTPLDHWLGGMSAPTLTPDDLVLRYLAAYGPATVKDVQTWCGLTRLGEVVERLGSRLTRLRHEDGYELVDLPDAPRPGAEVPAPVRFLYDFDNVMLSYADRSRMGGSPPPEGLYTQHGPLPGAVLVDGVFEGGWMINRTKERATIRVRSTARFSASDHDAITEEGLRLLAFLACDAPSHDVMITA